MIYRSLNNYQDKQYFDTIMFGILKILKGMKDHIFRFQTK